MPFTKSRNILLTILFTIITLGIYNIYLYFAVYSEIRNEAIRQNLDIKLVHPFTAFLLAIITLGIYFIYYVYKVAVVLQELNKRVGQISVAPVVVLIFTFILHISIYLNIYSESKYDDVVRYNNNRV